MMLIHKLNILYTKPLTKIIFFFSMTHPLNLTQDTNEFLNEIFFLRQYTDIFYVLKGYHN